MALLVHPDIPDYLGTQEERETEDTEDLMASLDFQETLEQLGKRVPKVQVVPLALVERLENVAQ